MADVIKSAPTGIGKLFNSMLRVVKPLVPVGSAVVGFAALVTAASFDPDDDGVQKEAENTVYSEACADEVALQKLKRFGTPCEVVESPRAE